AVCPGEQTAPGRGVGGAARPDRRGVRARPRTAAPPADDRGDGEARRPLGRGGALARGRPRLPVRASRRRAGRHLALRERARDRQPRSARTGGPACAATPASAKPRVAPPGGRRRPGGAAPPVVATLPIAPRWGGKHSTAAPAAILPPPWRIPVTVLNGSGDINYTRQVASHVGAFGYTIQKVGRAPSFAYPQTAVYF